MKKAILMGIGFAIGNKLVMWAELGVDWVLLNALANNDRFMAFMEANKPGVVDKIKPLRRK